MRECQSALAKILLSILMFSLIIALCISGLSGLYSTALKTNVGFEFVEKRVLAVHTQIVDTIFSL